MGVSHLKRAMNNPSDEWFTKYSDIEKECSHYEFAGKTIYCNCDLPQTSNFCKYFRENFDRLQLKRLIVSGMGSEDCGYVYDSDKNTTEAMIGNGDYRSEECISYLLAADIIITNPPFSKFREFIDYLMFFNKDFLVIGGRNDVKCKGIFEHVRSGKITSGYTVPTTFIRETGEEKASACCWFTTLPTNKPPMKLSRIYTPADYPKYDNYSAINVDKAKDIPCDYYGVMGVPLSFFTVYSKEQFEIIGATEYFADRHFPPMRSYEHIVLHKPDGSTEELKSIRRNKAYIELPSPPSNERYYELAEDGRLLTAKYARLFVRLKV